jgi:hypothetical protein
MVGGPVRQDTGSQNKGSVNQFSPEYVTVPPLFTIPAESTMQHWNERFPADETKASPLQLPHRIERINVTSPNA